MAPRTFSTRVRQRLYTFARRLATPFTDSRRRRFLADGRRLRRRWARWGGRPAFPLRIDDLLRRLRILRHHRRGADPAAERLPSVALRMYTDRELRLRAAAASAVHVLRRRRRADPDLRVPVRGQAPRKITSVPERRQNGGWWPR